MSTEDAHRVVVAGGGGPGEGLGDQQVLKCRREEEAGEKILAGVVEVGVPAAVARAGAGREMRCELRGLYIIGDVAERVPPPRGLLERDALRVECPYLLLTPGVPLAVIPIPDELPSPAPDAVWSEGGPPLSG